jgi:hypothetical protein
MSHDDYDDGLVHTHDWAVDDTERAAHPTVAEASMVNTPSSVFHDDWHHGAYAA